MNDSQRAYWTDRYETQGDTYVAKGGDDLSWGRQVKMIEPLLRQIVPAGGRILDFGCGPGRFRPVLEEIGSEYVGVDLISGMGTQPLEGELPTGFDCVVAIMVLQHITDDVEYSHWIDQLAKCLKPGGVIVAFDHNPMEDPDPHMNPRGMFPVLQLPQVSNLQGLGQEFDGHWCGGFWLRNCEEDPGDTPVFESREDGSTWLRDGDEMPDVLHITSELLAWGNPYAMRREGDTVEFPLANGRWVYKIIGWRERGWVAVCKLAYSEE